MTVDRITKDMRSMARSYNAPKPVALMQDKVQQAKRTVRSKVGNIQNAREAANDKAKTVVSNTAASIGKSVVKGATAAAKSIESGFEGLKQRNTERHRELINSQRSQTRLLTGMNNSVGGIHNMMFKERYGPKVEPYKRDGGDVSELANQLGQQHRELMQELEKIRRAIIMGNNGSMFDMLGGMRPGGRRNRNNRSNRGGGTNSGSSSATRTASAASSSWGRANAGGGGPSIHGGGWRGKLLDVGLKVAAGGATGYALFGGGGGNSDPGAGSTGNRSVSGASSPRGGLGSIAASNETTRGVHEISTGEGDHGGVSYGAHQLATETGSMQAFLDSPEGQPFASQFGNARPGTGIFDRLYAQVARNHEAEFAKAQKDYIDRTHYEPMFDNVMRGSGFDASGRGPAIQEMLYSTGVQYGTGTSVINRALAGHNPDQMSDADIIRTVQNFKGETVETYFRSSRPDIQESVRNRAYREMDQLLALDSQYQNGQLAEDSSSTPSPSGAQSPDVSESSQIASNVSSPSSEDSPLMGEGNSGNGLVTAAGAGAAVAAVGGASLLGSGPVSATGPAVQAPTNSDTIESRGARKAQSQAAAARPPEPPASVRRPSSPLNTERLNASRAVAASTAPPASIAAPSTPVAPKPTAASRVMGGARRLPVVSTALGVYDVANVMTNDEMSGSQKAGAVTDIAGGTVGGMVGAKAGAVTGGTLGLLGGPAAPVTVPVGAAVGGLVGGVAGYWAGSELTQTARGWIGDLFSDDEEREELPDNHPLQAGRRAEAQMRRRRARNGSGAEPEAQSISADAVISASEVAASAALAKAAPDVSASALEAASVVGAANSNTPMVVNNYPLQGEGTEGTPESEVASSTQVSQDAAGSSAEDSENSFLMDSASQLLFGAKLSAGMDATRPDAPEHMRRNLHGYDTDSSGSPVQSGTRAATAAAVTATGAAASASPEDAENSTLMNMASRLLFGDTFSAGMAITRPDAPEHMRRNLHGYEDEQPTAPTTVREGNRVSHDFTNRPAPKKPSTGSEITADDLETRPVGHTRSSAVMEEARNRARTGDPLGQANLEINDMHARMMVRPTSARSSLNIPGTRTSGTAAPAPGTAPSFMGSAPSDAISVGATGSSRSPSSGSPAADFSTQAVSDVPSRRQQHDSVQKVMMMEQAAPTHERKDLTPDPRSSSTSSTYEGRNHQPSIDDTPVLVSDFGLTLLNTGFI